MYLNFLGMVDWKIHLSNLLFLFAAPLVLNMVVGKGWTTLVAVQGLYD